MIFQYGNTLLFIALVLQIILVNCVVGMVADGDYILMPPLFYMDDYDRCMLMENSFYCEFSYQLEPLNNKLNSSKVWKIIQKVNSDVTNYRHDLLRHKICLQQSCPTALFQISNITNLMQEIRKCYDKKYFNIGLKGRLNELKCFSKESITFPKRDFDSFVKWIAFSYLILILVSSLYEIVLKYFYDEKYDKYTSKGFGWFLKTFSIRTNYQRLTTLNPEYDKLKSIQGVRFCITLAVIVAHSQLLQLSGPVLNPKYTENLNKDPKYSILLNGSILLQTFYLISAWLTTYQFFKNFEEHSSKMLTPSIILLTILDRFIRFMPTVAVMLLLHSTWLIHFGEGPLWDEMFADDYKSCNTNWWAHVLFLQNLIFPASKCFSHTWYLATDVQLHVTTVLILLIVLKYKTKTNHILVFFSLLGMVIPFFLVYKNEFDIVMRIYPEMMYKLSNNDSSFWRHLHVAPYSNFGGWMIGVWFGYFFYFNKEKQFLSRKFEIFWWLQWPMWLLIISGEHFVPATRLNFALYSALSKPLWAAVWGFLILGASQGLGSFLEWFGEWDVFQLLARLTYSAYLLHFDVIKFRVGLERTPVYSDNRLAVFSALGDIGVTFSLSFIFCLFIELPFSAFHGEFRKRLIKNKVP